MVYKGCASQGTTNSNGQITLSGLLAGDHLQVRKLVYTGGIPTSLIHKGAHDGWSYHVWQTNIVQHDEDGTQSDYVVTKPGIPQTVVVSPYNAQIGFNLVVSLDYNATPERLNEIAQELREGSEYLFDASDGQMFFENAVIYDDRVQWENADIRYFVNLERPTASLGGPTLMALLGKHVNMQLNWSNWGPSSLGHEWGHYAIGAYNEYVKWDQEGEEIPSTCTINREEQKEEAERASVMDKQWRTSEFCHDGNHNVDTLQQQAGGKSVWATLFSSWNGNGAVLSTPMSRGNKANPGPTSLPCFSGLNSTIFDNTVATCSPIVSLTVLAPGAQPGYQDRFNVTLKHGAHAIYQGEVRAGKPMDIIGAAPGDSIMVSRAETGPNNEPYISSGEVTISGCGRVIITTQTFLAYSPMPMPWFDQDTNEFGVFVDTRGTQPTLKATVDQDGQHRKEVELTFDERRGGYLGRYSTQRSVEPNFSLDIETVREGGKTVRSSYRYSAALFQSGPTPFWELFPADFPINLIAQPRLLSEGKAVLAGTTSLPTPPPDGLRVVGGPYSIQAGMDATPLASPTGWTFLYKQDLDNEVDPKSVSVYRFDQGKWLPVRARVNADHGEASILSDQWGVYAVFARSAK
jgi:hypothetical protein